MNRRVALLRPLATCLGKLLRDRSGVSILEFALVLPVLLTLGLYGTELAYMSMIKMQVGEIATSVADNASRLGQTDNSSVTPTVTETQVDSVMWGALSEGASFDFNANGRIILSSLEIDSASNRQYIHWQRCRGELDRASSYGISGTGKTGKVLDGMGQTDHKIYATANSAVMYVEVFFHYQPLFGDMFVKNTTFHQEAAFLIRDDRSLNPTGSTDGITGSGGQSHCT
ncbi:TadE/TadG family type IV pilus assembly protein [Novosphingobium aerophilum]|uniref:TadE/TadG family type IV pilus assembly protein n=1 Tax=Novosphingobium TaxID=165696 RepID=UPI0012CA7035|nr:MULTISPECIES: TadE/TadG family type IV pilus assembly protein [unclassified Novosphingobium]MPS70846.1 pilus assembly protein [Novosphingobium sp.]WRT94397.1 TadE/TadG family type IV pilus assembly protein [Novosphingobium sp. RL4]